MIPALSMRPTEIVLFESPDEDSDYWNEMTIRNQWLVNKGHLGYVIFESLDGKIKEHWTPIFYVHDEYTSGTVRPDNGLPYYISFEDVDYWCFRDNNVLEPVLWHELAHFYYADAVNHKPGVVSHYYDEEIRADRFAAQHVGVQEMIRTNKIILKEFHRPGEPGYTELLFRLSDLGDDEATQYIQEHGLDRSDILELGPPKYKNV